MPAGLCAQWAAFKCFDSSIPAAHLDAYTTCPTAVDQCTTTPAGAGVDADVIVYVKTDDPATDCGGTLASAVSCSSEPASNRPVAGQITLCEVNPGELASEAETATHELIHVLVRV